jgi:ribonuclease D
MKQRRQDTQHASSPYPDKPPIWVDTPDALAALIQCLDREPVIAVDTESDSLHAYFEKVCLIQFSVPGTDYLLDPLALPDLSALAPIFANPGVEKVFHAAEYDVMVLKRDHGFEFADLFDTMVASRLLGWPHHGLGSILSERFGIAQDKRMQRHNWARRPLSPAEMQYARLDTHYLLPLRQILGAELQERNLLDEAREMFDQITVAVWRGGGFDPDGFWRIRGARHLDPVGLAVLRELYLLRDREARRRDRPPFKVIADATLLHLAQSQPQARRELTGIKGMTPYLVRRYGRRVLRSIARGQRAKPPPPPQNGAHRRPDPKVIARYEALRAWRKDRAAERGVDPDVIVSNAALAALARRQPRNPADLEKIDGLGPVKRGKYGQEILQVLQQGQSR